MTEMGDGKESEPTSGKERRIPRFRSSPFTANNRGAIKEVQFKMCGRLCAPLAQNGHFLTSVIELANLAPVVQAKASVRMTRLAKKGELHPRKSSRESLMELKGASMEKYFKSHLEALM